MSSQFYLDKLYPLQDRVLESIAKIDTKFYLTGGTALSRFYYYHRFSEDLDFFLNYDKEFVKEANNLLEVLYIDFKDAVRINIREDSFVRLFVTQGDTVLKIELINDVGYHFGPTDKIKRVQLDNVQNILSNKISAIQRNASKDVADILEISFHFPFRWVEIFEQAKNKDTWVNEIDVATYLDSYDISQLETVLWTKVPDYNYLKQCLHTIAKDILLGAENSLKS